MTTHTDSVKSFLSDAGVIGGAVHLPCTCLQACVEEVRSRIRAAHSSAAAPHKVIGILNAEVTQVTVLF